MTTRKHLLRKAAPTVRQRLELIGRFEAKFDESPLVDPDSMPRSTWIGLMQKAFETGEISAQLRNRMGFVTSIREATQEEEPRHRKARALGLFEERNLEGDDEMVIGRLGPLPPGAKWTFPKAPFSVQSPLLGDADE